MGIRLDAEQNFTCRACAECCRRFDVAITEAEYRRYVAAHAEQWFQGDLAPDGSSTSPFRPMPGGRYRIVRKSDGACGFLSPGNRCRIHEELGGSEKPLACQVFPFSFEFRRDETFATQSFCCPTIVTNAGPSVAEQAKPIGALARKWRKSFSPPDAALEWVEGVSLTSDTLERMSWVFRRLLDSHDPAFSLRRNVRRIALLIDDWTRQRVLRFDSEQRAEYMKLTGEFAVTQAAEAPLAPGVLPRLFFRGLVFASLVPGLQREHGAGSALPLRLLLFRLAFHAHGLAPATPQLDLARGLDLRRALPLDEEPFFSPAYHVIRAAIENLGSSKRPVAEALNLAVAHIAVAEAIYLARPESSSGASPAWVRAIMDAHDVAHVEPRSAFGRVLRMLTPPPAALQILGHRGDHVENAKR